MGDKSTLLPSCRRAACALVGFLMLALCMQTSIAQFSEGPVDLLNYNFNDGNFIGWNRFDMARLGNWPWRDWRQSSGWFDLPVPPASVRSNQAPSGKGYFPEDHGNWLVWGGRDQYMNQYFYLNRMSIHSIIADAENVNTANWGVYGVSQSTQNSTTYTAGNVPLNTQQWCWKPARTDLNPWIQFDMYQNHDIYTIGIQGNPEPNLREWTTSYELQYLPHIDYNCWDNNAAYRPCVANYPTAVHWNAAYYRDSTAVNTSTILRFPGSNNQNTTVYFRFPTPITARWVRVIPRTWVGDRALRVDLFGVMSGPAGATPIGVASYPNRNPIPDPQMRCNTSNPSWIPSSARLYRQSCWRPALLMAGSSVSEFLEIEFNANTDLTAISTQGCANAAAWVRSYRLEFSKTGEDFFPYLNSSGRSIIFRGNVDQNTIETSALPTPLKGIRFLRIRPLSWQTTNGIGLRVELYGIPTDVPDAGPFFWSDYSVNFLMYGDYDQWGYGVSFYWQDWDNYYDFRVFRGQDNSTELVQASRSRVFGMNAFVNGCSPGAAFGTTCERATDNNPATHFTSANSTLNQYPIWRWDFRAIHVVDKVRVLWGPINMGTGARPTIRSTWGTGITCITATDGSGFLGIPVPSTWVEVTCLNRTIRLIDITRPSDPFSFLSIAELKAWGPTIPSYRALTVRKDGLFTLLASDNFVTEQNYQTTNPYYGRIAIRDGRIRVWFSNATTIALGQNIWFGLTPPTFDVMDTNLTRGSIACHNHGKYLSYWDDFRVVGYQTSLPLNRPSPTRTLAGGSYNYFNITLPQAALGDALQVSTTILSATGYGLQIFLRPLLFGLASISMNTQEYRLSRDTASTLLYPNAPADVYSIAVFNPYPNNTVSYSVTASPISSVNILSGDVLTGRWIRRGEYAFFRFLCDASYDFANVTITVTNAGGVSRPVTAYLQDTFVPTREYTDFDYSSNCNNGVCVFQIMNPNPTRVMFIGLYGLSPSQNIWNYTISIVMATPFLGSVNPTNTGTAGGGFVVYSGQNFGVSGTAYMGNATCNSSPGVGGSYTPASITCTAPPGEGSVNVYLINRFGLVSNTRNFTYNAPFANNVAPPNGPAAGNVNVVVFGNDLGLNPSIRIGGSLCPVVSRTHSAVTCTLPNGIGAGRPVQVTVAGQVSNLIAFNYDPPQIFSVTPRTGRTLGGPLTLTGLNFGTNSSVATVSVGGVGCTINFLNDTYATCTRLAGPGGVGYTVSMNVNGQSGSNGAQTFSYLAPTITTVFPANGPTIGNANLTIVGDNFGDTPSVSLGTSSCTIAPGFNHTVLICSTPAGQGVNRAVVVSAFSQSSNSTASYNYDAPTITAVTPPNPRTDGTTVLTYIGKNFGLSAVVTLGGIECSQTFANHTVISCIAPVGQGVGVASVLVVSSLSTSVNINYAAPVIQTIFQNSSLPTSGAVTITINGINLGVSGSVLVNGFACPPVGSGWGHLQIRCTLPVGSGLNRPVIVTVSTQISNTISVSYAAPFITSLAPPVIPTQGSLITLIGTNFFTTGSVLVNGVPCTFAAQDYSHTQIVCQTAAGRGFNKQINVTVASQVSNNVVITYAPPTVSSLLPITGVTSGLTGLTLTGTSFDTTGTVTVGPYGCTFVSWSHTQIICNTTAGQGVNHNVIITTNAPESQSSVMGFLFSYIPPAIVSTSPSSLPTLGNVIFTVLGTNFGLNGNVTIDSRLCTNPVWSHTNVTCTAPIGSGVNENVVLTTGTGQASPAALTNRNVPVITSISRVNGPTIGGYNITLVGTDFAFAGVPSSVTIGTDNCPITFRNHTSIVCTVAATSNGPKLVQTSIDGQLSNSLGFTFDAPSVTTVDPLNGPTRGNNLITIVGASFGLNPLVTIASTNCLIQQFNHTFIICAAPVGQGLAQPLVVSNVQQIGSSATFNYNYDAPTITSISPANAGTVGNTFITLIGSNFGTLVTISVGGVLCSSVAPGSNHNTSVCRLPASSNGGANIPTVITVSSQVSAAFNFRYDTPFITSATTPQAGTPGGYSMTIQGNSFGTGGSVLLGLIPCPSTSWTHGQIVCTVPAGSGANIVVNVTRGGQSSNSDITFSYSVPTFSSIAPLNGPTSGIDPTTGLAYALTLNGANFGLASLGTLFIAGRVCDPVGSGWSHTRIECALPQGHSTGNAIVVSAGGQNATASQVFGYDAVVVTSLTPISSPTAGNVALFFAGNNFGIRSGQVFTIGGKTATIVSSNHTNAQVTLPAGSGSGAAYAVVNAGNRAQSTSFSYFAPVVTSISSSGPGCVVSGNSVSRCVINGFYAITLTGTDFGTAADPISITVAGNACQNVTVLTNHTSVRCDAQAGTGLNVPVVITVNGQAGTSNLFSYENPTAVSFALVSDYKPDNTSLFLTSTFGNEAIAVVGYFFGTDSTALTVTYGLPGQTKQFACTVQAAGFNDTYFTCLTSSSVGENLVMEISRALSVPFLSARTLVSAESAYTITHPRAFFVAASICNPTDCATTKTSTWVSARVNELIRFEAYHLGTNPANIRLALGDTGSFKAYTCTIQTGSFPASNPAVVDCTVGPGDGGPFVFVALALNHLSAESQFTYKYPTRPRLDSITGCDADPSNVNNTMNCNTEGGTVVTVFGTDFTTAPSEFNLFIGLSVCADPVVKCSDSTSACNATCTLAAGVGASLPIYIRSGALFSATRNLLSYARPTVFSVLGCTDVGNETTECSRDTLPRPVVTISGINFGPNRPIIIVGGKQCLSVVVTTAHRVVECTLPADSGLRKAVIFVQGGGQLGLVPGLMSYLPCPKGQFGLPESTICTDCGLGSFNDVVGQTFCKQCENGFFADVPGLSVCGECLAGSYSARSVIGGVPTGAQNCTACSSGYVASVNGQDACLPCSVGQFAPTTGLVVCQNCPAGFATATAGSPTCGACNPGTYTTATGQVVCSSCPEGRFADVLNSTTCDQCFAGTFADIPARPSCTRCPLGTAIPERGQVACRRCNSGFFANDTGLDICFTCPAGSYSVSSTLSAVGPVGCTLCPAGQYIGAAGQGLCLDCAKGFYNPTEGQALCAACPLGTATNTLRSPTCTNCTVGRFAGSTGTEDCTPCAVGTFAVSGGASACDLCPVGSFQANIEQTHCDPCDVGYFATAPGQFACKPCRVGTFANVTGLADCMSCPPGTYTPIASLPATSCQLCEVGKFSSASGQSECFPCPAGTYAPFPGFSQCIPCAAGTATPLDLAGEPIPGQASCTNCSAGEYAPEIGGQRCLDCPAGRAQLFPGSNFCDVCPAGTSSGAGQPSCTACAAGTFTSAAGQPSCFLCPAGTYENNTGLSVCRSCAPGSFQDQEGKQSCTPCEEGYFTGEFRQTQCAPCAPGNYAESTGAAACTPCAAGSATDAQASPSCAACPIGRFASSSGSIECQPCPAGTAMNELGQSQCTPCALGRFQDAIGAVACKDCIKGSAANVTGQLSCDFCPPGRIAAVDRSAVCTPCAAGSFADNAGSYFCDTCTGGSYSPVGSAACFACDVGTYSGDAAGACTPCSPGSAQGVPGQSSCIDCEAGKAVDVFGQTSCPRCRDGAYSNTTGLSVCSLCDAGYQSTGTNDNGPIACDVCAAGTFTASPGQPSCSACDAGSYAEFPAQSFCSLCSLGFYNDQPAQPACTACAAGKYAGSDGAKLCQDCPVGSFQVQSGQSECTPCSPGFFQETPARTFCDSCRAGSFTGRSGQGVCLTCPTGTYNPSLNASVCTFCERGRFQPLEGQLQCTPCGMGSAVNATGQPICVQCDSGQFAPSTGMSACQLCPPGRVSSKTNGIGPMSCTQCSAGTYRAEAGQEFCQSCPTGTFNNADGQSSCSNCPKGTYSSSSSSTICLVCDLGYFASFDGAANCDACVAGTFSDGSPSLVDNSGDNGLVCDMDGNCVPRNSTIEYTAGPVECFSCPIGTYQSSSAAQTCNPCEAGKYQDNARSQTCKACPTGTYSVGTGNTACIRCTRGYYQGLQGSTDCLACDPGRFADISAAAECEFCETGTYMNAPAASLCIDCNPGFYQNIIGQTNCTACPTGQFQPALGEKECNFCPIGSYNDKLAATHCTSCERGKYQDGNLATTCKFCDVGTSSNATGATICPPCNRGTFTNTTGNFICIDCNPGQYQSSFGETTCDLCPRTRYNPNIRKAICDLCPTGRSGNVTGALDCDPCVPGSFQDGLGQASCKLCQVGKSQVQSGQPECLACVPGKYSDRLGSKNCTECIGGSFQSEPQQTMCLICSAGTFSGRGSPGCTKCGTNTVAPNPGSTLCLPCPARASSNRDNTVCECDPGLVSRRLNGSTEFDKGFTCENCPEGGVCDRKGLTIATLYADAGFYLNRDLFDPQDITIFRCTVPSYCLGGVDPDRQCAENRGGFLCFNCIPGFQRTVTGDCAECPAQGASIRNFVLIGISILLVVWGFYFIMIRAGVSIERDVISRLVQEEVGAEDEEMVDAVMTALGKGHKHHADPRVAQILGTAAKQTRTAGRHIGNFDIYGAPPPKPDFTFKIKIALSFFQIITNLSLGLEIRWPSVFKSFLALFNILNFDFLGVSSVDCVTRVNYFNKLFYAFFLPFCLLIVSVIYYAVYGFCLIKNKADPVPERKLARRNAWKLVFFNMFLVYPGVSSIFLRYFVCKSVKTDTYETVYVLFADLETRCFTDSWNDHLPLVFAGILVYPVGIALFFYAMLYRYRLRLTEVGIRHELGFLYDAYEYPWWFFELFDMAHKLNLTSMIPFFTFDAQLPIAMAVACIYMMIILFGKPYMRKGDDRLSLFAQAELILLLLAGYMLINDIEYDYTYDIVLSIVLIFIVSLIVLLFLVGLFTFLYKCIKDCRQRREDREAAKILNTRKLGSLLLDLMPKPPTIPARTYPKTMPERVANTEGAWSRGKKNDDKDVKDAAPRGSVVGNVLTSTDKKDDKPLPLKVLSTVKKVGTALEVVDALNLV
jgi:hypothetical protein